jgi:hypothetical protein
MTTERRIIHRRKFGYYMPVFDAATDENLGYLSDINQRGFKLESNKILPVNTVYSLRLNLSSAVSSVAHIAFTARVAWSQADPYAPMEFVSGFQIMRINPEEQRIFDRLVEMYSVA